MRPGVDAHTLSFINILLLFRPGVYRRDEESLENAAR